MSSLFKILLSFCLRVSAVPDTNALIFVVVVMYVIFFFLLDVSNFLVFVVVVFNSLCLGVLNLGVYGLIF